MADLKVYCGTEFLGTVPRPEYRSDFVCFTIPGDSPGHPSEYWIARGYLGDPTELRVSYEIRPLAMAWDVEFVMMAPESGSTRDLLHKIPGWRSAPPRRIINLPSI